MANALTPSQLEQLRRNARRTARTQSIPRHEALDRLAREHGFANWSTLAKACSKSAPPHSGPAAPENVPAAPEPAAGRVLRYYLHGDQLEADAGRYYCACCDQFVPAGHFAQWHTREVNLERYARMQHEWQRGPSRWRRGLRRPKDASNILAPEGDVLVAARQAARSPFHRWLEQQQSRNDLTGMFARIALQDEAFPAQTSGHSELRDRVLAWDEAELGTFEQVWKEFQREQDPR